MFLVGSEAAREIFPDFRKSISGDLDIFITKSLLESITKNGTIINVIFDKPFHVKANRPDGQKIELEIIEDDFEEKCNYQVYGPEILMALKRSHLYWPHNWFKHIEDYHFFKSKGVVLNEEWQAWLKERIKLTEERLGKPMTPNLNVSKEEFFGRSSKRVDYFFDHDDIHKIMAHQDKPIYSYMLKDNAPIYCDKNKFEALPYEWQLQAVMEEAYVIAIERKILPMLWSGAPFTTALDAYKWAIMRICTNLTSGWFREFAIENYPEFIKRYDNNYVLKFLTAYENKQIIRQK